MTRKTSPVRWVRAVLAAACALASLILPASAAAAAVMAAPDALPDAKLSYFNSYPDMAAAMKANKIDGFPGDGPVLMLMAAESPR